MTAESLIIEFKTLSSAEQKKFFAYLAERAGEITSKATEEGDVTDLEFDAALRKVMVENRELLHRLAQ